MVRSENLKLYTRKSTWLMLAFLLFWTVFSVAANQDIERNLDFNLWGKVANQTAFIFLVELFTVIVAGGIVANEYNWGTIKLLLIRPVRRSRILLAKYLAVLLFGALMMVILFGFSFTAYSLLGLFNGRGAGASLAAGKWWFNSLGGALGVYALKYLEVVIYGTLAFMLSALSKSTALTVGSVSLTILLGPELTQLIAHYNWAKYLLFLNLNLPQYLNGRAPLPGMSLLFSLGILALYGVGFYLIAWAAFVRRDVL